MVGRDEKDKAKVDQWERNFHGPNVMCRGGVGGRGSSSVGIFCCRCCCLFWTYAYLNMCFFFGGVLEKYFERQSGLFPTNVSLKDLI